MEDYKRALEYHRKALEHIKAKEKTVPSTYYNQVGNDLYGLEEYEEAVMNHKESLRLAEKENKPYSTSVVHNCLGHAYAALGQYEKAYESFHSALDIRKALFGAEDDRVLQCEENVKRVKNLMASK